MKIAITGCNGSVGTRVVLKALEQGHSVVGIDVTPKPDSSPLTTFYQLDLRDYDPIFTVFQNEKIEGIVHLAGIRTPEDYLVKAHNNNVTATWNIYTAAGTLGIKRLAMASSVNVINLVWSKTPIKLDYFPIDENHPTLPDEPYGLSKVIGEIQADSVVKRWPDMRIASIRLHYSVPGKKMIQEMGLESRTGDLWGYIQEDSGAEAFLTAVTDDSLAWKGHEAFFIASPTIAFDGVSSESLRKKYYPNVPVKDGKELAANQGFFDCTKAETMLGWVHKDTPSDTLTLSDHNN
ncbi:NAD(P)-binding protein [Flagelloscypha sp. PMI_526]|nr:NAD(P)-binding protein [Flagelloscypha sp. PMI_526]